MDFGSCVQMVGFPKYGQIYRSHDPNLCRAKAKENQWRVMVSK